LLFVPKNSLLPEYVRKVLESVILRFLITAKRLEKSPETDRFQDFSGCGGKTRTYGLRVMSCFRMAQLTISGHFGQHCMQKRLLSGELGSAVSVYFF